MDINLIIASKAESYDLLKKVLTEHFSLDVAFSENLIKNDLIKHFDQLIDECYLLAESNYIDKVYRDSYYNYYSTKLIEYNRNCVRISLFDGEVEGKDFRNEASIKKLYKRYLGFFILRPTIPFILGRSIVSPIALKTNNFSICTSIFNTSCNSVKLSIEGFPHSSQDTETISCAETTLWSIMEYFSSKYPEYKPVLPSRIIKTLNQISTERQIPSRGLNIQQISFALREFGFGTRIYSREEYKNEFFKLLSCYIESGIPLVTALDDRQHGGNIGHANLCIGHENGDSGIDSVQPSDFSNKDLKKKFDDRRIIIYDYDDMRKEFVFVDDNLPVYQKAPLDKPTIHYGSEWQKCEITYFVVPLYPKIYLEAFEAKNFILNFLVTKYIGLSDGSEIVLRIFLTSSRSFKDKVASNDQMQSDLKEAILLTMMPKFIWIAELSTKELMKKKNANGLLIIDATEANIQSFKPLIIAAYQNLYIYYDHSTNMLIKNLFTLQDFNIFENNLRNYRK